MDKENLQVKKDIIQTVVVNIVFVAILIGLYYWNQNAGQPLDNWVKNLIRF